MKIDIDKIRRSVGFVGESDTVLEMLALVGQVASTDISVLITGESGSGKEMVAKAVHRNSKRKFEKLITVNCAAIPSGIIESELFGHKKGSFTGANEQRKGYFEAANKGTIFLDEIGELPLETQAKLLRVIEDGEYIKVGDENSKKVDVRLVAATNRNLEEEVKKGNFRKDLYFRLKTINIVVPSLRNHISDLYLFVERFGLEFSTKNDIPFKGFTKESIALLKRYSWPGNVRELKNVIESLLVINKGQRITEEMILQQVDSINSIDVQSDSSLPVHLNKDSESAERELILKQLLLVRQDINEIKNMLLNKDLPDQIEHPPSSNMLYLPPSESPSSGLVKDNNLEDGQALSFKEDAIGEFTISEIEREIIERTLDKNKGNRRETAKSLDISERTLYRKIKEFGIDKKRKKI